MYKLPMSYPPTTKKEIIINIIFHQRPTSLHTARWLISVLADNFHHPVPRICGTCIA